ncbi:hypothetical protein OF001_U650003 [Pseudomonas sp. OF001]|nr:hypothetical protein OF001_U650003 [Pseudomonas sp. OF001]
MSHMGLRTTNIEFVKQRTIIFQQEANGFARLYLNTAWQEKHVSNFHLNGTINRSDISWPAGITLARASNSYRRNNETDERG